MTPLACAGLFGVLFVTAQVPPPVIQGSPSPAQSFEAADPDATVTIAAPGRHKTPFSKLFEQSVLRPIVVAAPGAAARGLRQPDIVCGMKVFRGDSSIDPKMVLPRADSGTRYPIRLFEAPIPCR